MTTPRQILKELGFKFSRIAANSMNFEYEVHVLEEGKTKLATAGLDYATGDNGGTSSRHWDIYVVVGGKRKKIVLGALPMKPEHETLFRELLNTAKQEGLMKAMQPKKAKAPAKPLTEEQKAERKVWKFLGDQYATSFDASLKADCSYIRTPNRIRIEDSSQRLPYGSITWADLLDAKMDMDLNELEAWLKAHGVQRKPNPRRTQAQIRASMPRYD